MTTLCDLADGRDNHFNLIRMVAALAVLVSHAWPVTLGKGTPEPWQAATGHSLGTWAVFVFFALSGYLVAGSLARTEGLADFLRARLLRIVPALAVSSWLVALGLGPLVTTLPLGEYLTQPRLWAFVARNSVPVSHLFDLPGVFTTNPYPHPVGSIWTLPYEVACYALLVVLGWLGLLRRSFAFAVTLGVCLALWLGVETGQIALTPRVDALRVLFLPFLLGVAFHHWRAFVPIKGWAAAGLALGLAVLPATLHGTVLYDPVLCLAITYGVLWVGHLNAPLLDGYRRLGDYSYGTYLYAFPLQGLAVWLWGPLTPHLNVALAIPPTLLCAILSWHLIERPTLHLRHQRRTGRAGKRL